MITLRKYMRGFFFASSKADLSYNPLVLLFTAFNVARQGGVVRADVRGKRRPGFERHEHGRIRDSPRRLRSPEGVVGGHAQLDPPPRHV